MLIILNLFALTLPPNDGSKPLPDLAAHIAAYVEKNVAAKEKIDFVRFSMG